jgi:hypothetical protein
MKRSAIILVMAGLLAFAITLYLKSGSDATALPPAHGKTQAAPQANPAAPAAAPRSMSGTPPRPDVDDPRLVALMNSSGETQVEWIPDADGRLIRELDSNPDSPGYRKPLRDYTYVGGKLSSVTRYRYLGGNQVEIRSARVAYRADGSVDQVQESVRVEPVEGSR